MNAPSLEVFPARVDGALSKGGKERGPCDGRGWELDELQGLFQPEPFYGMFVSK